MKKMLFGATCLLIAGCFLVGCGGKDKKEESNTTTNATTQTTTQKAEQDQSGKVQVKYNNGTSLFEITYITKNIKMEEESLKEPQDDVYLTYFTDNNRHTYEFNLSEDNTSAKDFYDENVNDCKSRFDNVKATELRKIPCGNITCYEFTLTYTDKQGKAVTAPIYFAEIKEGLYLYVSLADTIQYGEVDKEMLTVNENMLKDLFVNVKVF